MTRMHIHIIHLKKALVSERINGSYKSLIVNRVLFLGWGLAYSFKITSLRIRLDLGVIFGNIFYTTH